MRRESVSRRADAFCANVPVDPQWWILYRRIKSVLRQAARSYKVPLHLPCEAGPPLPQLGFLPAFSIPRVCCVSFVSDANRSSVHSKP